MLKLRWPDWGWLNKAILVATLVIGAASFYLWHLGKLTRGLSPAEAVARAASRNVHTIRISPVNAPQRLLQYAVQSAGHHGAFWVRLPSVALALVLLAFFYMLVRIWFGRLVGFLAAILLASTPWLVLLARNATPDILFFAPIALLAVYDWYKRVKPKRQRMAWLSLVVAGALCLYIPGLVWLILAGAIVTRKRLADVPEEVGQVFFLISLGLGLILLLPLIVGVAGAPGIAKQLLLWPAHWQTPMGTLKSIAWSGLAIVWHTPYHIPTIIGRLPVLDATQIVLGIFGAIALWNKARPQLYMLVGLIGYGVIAAGVDHNLLLITLALPALAILSAAGLRYLYVEWRSIFPSNPLPRTLAIVILAVLVGLHVMLGGRYVLAAWPNTVSTRQVYVIK